MKKNKLILFGLFFILLGINGCGNDWDDNESVNVVRNVITKDSELFKLIEGVTSEGNNPTEHVVCLDFIYPINVLVYDSDLHQIGIHNLIGDNQFSAFLGQLPSDHSISISYPISTTLADGTIFRINNNQELKLAIDSCSKEDIISYCSGLFGDNSPCVWKIQYTDGENNKYTSGFFEANGDGSLTFRFDGTSYVGTWVFLFVDDKLHMNIHLGGTSQVAQDLSIDREVEVTETEMRILNGQKDIILRKSCQTLTEYHVGETGPAGGIVFYDKGSYSEGWRYIETSLIDLGPFEWGCSGSQTQSISKPEIGSGLFNSAVIANYHDDLTNYYAVPAICNALNNGTVAAKKALQYNLNSYKDWFLPSENELQLMYQNLHTQNLGNYTNSLYWSSTEIDGTTAKAINFSNGTSVSAAKIPSVVINTRAVRYF